MKIDNSGRVLSFSEKPKGKDLKAMVKTQKHNMTELLTGLEAKMVKFISIYMLQEVDTTVLGLSKDEALRKPYIASMGVYVFKKEILLNILRYQPLLFIYEFQR